MKQSVLCFILTCFSSFSGIRTHIFKCEDMCYTQPALASCMSPRARTRGHLCGVPMVRKSHFVPALHGGLAARRQRGGCVHRALVGRLCQVPYFCVPGWVREEQPREPVSGTGGRWLSLSSAGEPSGTAKLLCPLSACEL